MIGYFIATRVHYTEIYNINMYDILIFSDTNVFLKYNWSSKRTCDITVVLSKDSFGIENTKFKKIRSQWKVVAAIGYGQMTKVRPPI